MTATVLPSKYADIGQIQDSAEALFTRGATDFQFFAGLCIPHVMRYPFPPLYIAIWQMLITAVTREDRERVLRYALGLPRGFAKTTFLKILLVWMVVYDKISFALIVGATERLSQNFLSDVNDILSSPNIEAIYGPWNVNLATDNKEEKKASYRRRIVILIAAGAGTAVRGINLAYMRPDFLLCDDMQSKENATSETESNALLDWFVGTLLKVVDPFFSTMIYSGNMYPAVDNCILAKLQNNPEWTTLITGAILADGQSLWESVRPIDALWKDFKHDEALGRSHIWFAEMMNQSTLEGVSLLPNGIPDPPLTTDEIIPDAGFMLIDPAGLKKISDDNVVTANYVIGSTVAVQRLIAGKTDPILPIQTPKEVIEATITIAQELGIRIIGIEGVAYQATLEFWFREVLQEKGLENHFIFIDLAPHGVQKEKRIINSIKNLMDKSWFFADPDARQRYTFQALSYKLGKPKQKDDILDTCAYIEEMRRPENWSTVLSVPMSGPVANYEGLTGYATPF